MTGVTPKLFPFSLSQKLLHPENHRRHRSTYNVLSCSARRQTHRNAMVTTKIRPRRDYDTIQLRHRSTFWLKLRHDYNTTAIWLCSDHGATTDPTTRTGNAVFASVIDRSYRRQTAVERPSFRRNVAAHKLVGGIQRTFFLIPHRHGPFLSRPLHHVLFWVLLTEKKSIIPRA